MPSRPGGLLLSPRVAIASLSEEASESERIVLGSLVLDASILSRLTVTGSDFSSQHHKIFDAMLAVLVDHESVDTFLVAEELRRRRQYWEGAATYVCSLTDGLPRRVAIEGHCEKIRGAAIRRKLARLCEDTLSGCVDAMSRPVELLERHRAAILELVDNRSSNSDSLALICGSDVAAETAQWLIAPYLPTGQLALLVGDPGSGKTFVSIALAAGITAGRPPFSEPCEPQNVLYLSNEDAPSILRGRFDALGGDARRVWFESPERAISLADHGGIEAAIKKHEAVLVIVDTVTTHFGARVDFHKASEVAAVLSPLVAMAQRSGATVLGLMHLSKASQSHSLYRVQGSTAFAGAARSILAIGTDPSDPALRVLTHLKSNGCAEGASRRFTIGGDGVTWGETTDLRAADVLRSEATAEDRGELATAKEFLREALSGGSRDAAEVRGEAKEQQISERTLKRAKSALGVKSRKSSFGGGWLWWLDGQEGQEVGQPNRRVN